MASVGNPNVDFLRDLTCTAILAPASKPARPAPSATQVPQAPQAIHPINEVIFPPGTPPPSKCLPGPSSTPSSSSRLVIDLTTPVRDNALRQPLGRFKCWADRSIKLVQKGPSLFAPAPSASPAAPPAAPRQPAPASEASRRTQSLARPRLLPTADPRIHRAKELGHLDVVERRDERLIGPAPDIPAEPQVSKLSQSLVRPRHSIAADQRVHGVDDFGPSDMVERLEALLLGLAPDLPVEPQLLAHTELQNVQTSYEDEASYAATYMPLLWAETAASVQKALNHPEYPVERLSLVGHTELVGRPRRPGLLQVVLEFGFGGPLGHPPGASPRPRPHPYSELDLVLVLVRGAEEPRPTLPSDAPAPPPAPHQLLARVVKHQPHARLAGAPGQLILRAALPLSLLDSPLSAGRLQRASWQVRRLLSLAPTYKMVRAITTLGTSPLHCWVVGPPPPTAPAAPQRLAPVVSPALKARLQADYNTSQRQAILTALGAREGVTVICGPPGTGKTQTLVGLLLALCCPRPAQDGAPGCARRVLVCAPSNTAIDELALRLHQTNPPSGEPLRVVRLGVSDKIHPKVRATMYLDTLVNRRASETEGRTEELIARFEAASKKADQLKILRLAQMSAGTEGLRAVLWDLQAAEQDKAALLAGEVQKAQLRCKARAKIRASILAEAQVVCTTLGACRELTSGYDTVIIDEAAQCTEPQALVALLCCNRHCVFVGDPKQLPATVLSRPAAECHYDQSLMARLLARGHPAVVLDTQYRMDPSILRWPNRQFYESRLRNGQNVVQYRAQAGALAGLLPYCFFDVRGVEVKLQGQSSWRNPEEARCVAELVALLAARLGTVSEGRIGVITPYRAQQEEVQKALRTAGLAPQAVEVNVVDSFQGREMDVIILSCVRGGPKPGPSTGIGFLSNANRLNVALTRARRLLYIVGHAPTLAADPLWGSLVGDAEARQCFRRLRSPGDVSSIGLPLLSQCPPPPPRPLPPVAGPSSPPLPHTRSIRPLYSPGPSSNTPARTPPLVVTPWALPRRSSDSSPPSLQTPQAARWHSSPPHRRSLFTEPSTDSEGCSIGEASLLTIASGASSPAPLPSPTAQHHHHRHRLGGPSPMKALPSGVTAAMTPAATPTPTRPIKRVRNG